MGKRVLFLSFLFLSFFCVVPTLCSAAATRERNATGYSSDEDRVADIFDFLASYAQPQSEAWNGRCKRLYLSYTHRSMTVEHVEQIVSLLELRLGKHVTQILISANLGAFVQFRFNRLRTFLAVSDYFVGSDATNDLLRNTPKKTMGRDFFARCVQQAFPSDTARQLTVSIGGPSSLHEPHEKMELVNRSGGVLTKQKIEEILGHYLPNFRSLLVRGSPAGSEIVPVIVAAANGEKPVLPGTLEEGSDGVLVARFTRRDLTNAGTENIPLAPEGGRPPETTSNAPRENEVILRDAIAASETSLNRLQEILSSLSPLEQLSSNSLQSLVNLLRNGQLNVETREIMIEILRRNLNRKVEYALGSVSNDQSHRCVLSLIALGSQ